MRTINGKEVSVILNELQKLFTDFAVDFNGKPYLPYEQIKQRANAVLGLNYSHNHSLSFEQIEGEFCVIVHAKISIYDDSGNFVCERSHTRSDILQRYSEKRGELAGKLSFDNDDFSSVVSLAYKKAWAMFGLGDQFSVKKAENSCDQKIKISKTEPNDGEDKPLKVNVTLVKKLQDEDGNRFVFQNSEGRQITLKGSPDIENYKKLLASSAGTSFNIVFMLKSKKLLKIA